MEVDAARQRLLLLFFLVLQMWRFVRARNATRIAAARKRTLFHRRRALAVLLADSSDDSDNEEEERMTKRRRLEVSKTVLRLYIIISNVDYLCDLLSQIT